MVSVIAHLGSSTGDQQPKATGPGEQGNRTLHFDKPCRAAQRYARIGSPSGHRAERARSGMNGAAAPNNKARSFRCGPPLLVGVTGFEPATTCTPCKCATGLRYTPRMTCPTFASKARSDLIAGSVDPKRAQMYRSAAPHKFTTGPFRPFRWPACILDLRMDRSPHPWQNPFQRVQGFRRTVGVPFQSLC